MKYLLAILFAILIAGCTNPSNAIRILEIEGATDIKIEGFCFYCCGDRDWFHTEFSAKKNGRYISGAVCEGLFFKASTIRYF